MAANSALLMDIHFPDGSESLFLMTGRGFEFLGEDAGGREIYGIRHNGREYLFFPFSFKPVEAGVLSLLMPPEYEESCLDHRADGARVVFGAVHGVPFFPDMPEEFRSNSGTISVNASGSLRVLLDKAEPGLAPSEGVECGCDCGQEGKRPTSEGRPAHSGETRDHTCGHHHHVHGRDGRCCGEHAHGHVHATREPGSADGDQARTGMRADPTRLHDRMPPNTACVAPDDDAGLARTIRQAAEALNDALRKGHEAGLAVSLYALSRGQHGADECPRVCVRQIARPL